jgi:hypothetical protein
MHRWRSGLAVPAHQAETVGWDTFSRFESHVWLLSAFSRNSTRRRLPSVSTGTFAMAMVITAATEPVKSQTMAMANIAGATLRSVATSKAKRGKSFSEDANERVRQAVRELLAEPEHSGNQTKLALKLGISQPSLSTFLSGQKGAGPEMAAAVAKMVGLTFEQLVTGKQGMRRFRELDGWAEAEAEARRRYRRIPDYAWRGAGNLMAAEAPQHIDERVVLHFAEAWMLTASEDAIEKAERDEVLSVMAEEDRSRGKQPPLPMDPEPLPKARKRSTRRSPTPPPTSHVVETEPLPLEDDEPKKPAPKAKQGKGGR